MRVRCTVHAGAIRIECHIEHPGEAPWYRAPWGHDTFIHGLVFPRRSLRDYRRGLLAKSVLIPYFDSNHSK